MNSHRRQIAIRFLLGAGPIVLFFFSFSPASLPGKDIYWYGVQAASLLDTGRLHAPDRSPVFHIVSAIFSLFGKSEFSLFLFELLTYSFLCVCGFLTQAMLRKSQVFVKPEPVARSAGDDAIANFPFYIFCAGLWVSFLYPKQAWALGFAAIGTAGLIAFLTSPRTFKSALFLFLSATALMIAAWFHSLFLILGPILAACSAFWFAMKYADQKYRSYSFWIFALTGVSCWFIIALIRPNSLFGGRISAETDILTISNWPPAASFSIYGLSFILEWIIVFAAGLRNRKLLPFFFSLILGLLFLPWFSFADLQFRILISFVWLAQVSLNDLTAARFLSPIVTLLWLLTLIFSRSSFQHDYEKFRQAMTHFHEKPETGLLVAHHGFCEYIKFFKSIDCLSFKPDEKALAELPPGARIFRIVSGFSKNELEFAFDRDGRPIFHETIDQMGDYLLTSEEDWQRFHDVKQNERDESSLNRIENWANPWQTRPAFMLENYRGAK